MEEKVITRISFNPGLALAAGFLPCFQQVNLKCARDQSKNQHLVSSQLQKARDVDEL